MIRKPRIYYNARCASCRVVQEKMIAIGAVILCEGCFNITFKTDDPVRKESETYLGVLEMQKLQALKDI